MAGNLNIKGPAKKKTAGKKKSNAKRKLASKKLSILTTETPEEKKARIVKQLAATFWGTFGMNAKVTVLQPECLNKATALGALANINSKYIELTKYGDVYNQAIDCSARAGLKAYALATTGPKPAGKITDTIFEKAWQWIADGNAKLAKRKAKGGGDFPIHTDGVLC